MGGIPTFTLRWQSPICQLACSPSVLQFLLHLVWFMLWKDVELRGIPSPTPPPGLWPGDSFRTTYPTQPMCCYLSGVRWGQQQSPLFLMFFSPFYKDLSYLLFLCVCVSRFFCKARTGHKSVEIYFSPHDPCIQKSDIHRQGHVEDQVQIHLCSHYYAINSCEGELDWVLFIVLAVMSH